MGPTRDCLLNLLVGWLLGWLLRFFGWRICRLLLTLAWWFVWLVGVLLAKSARCGVVAGWVGLAIGLLLDWLVG